MGYYIGQILAVMIAVRISMYLEKRIRSLWKKSSSKTDSKQRQQDMVTFRTGDLIIIFLLLCIIVLLIAFVMYLAGF
jgi:hypothetical protein